MEDLYMLMFAVQMVVQPDELVYALRDRQGEAPVATDTPAKVVVQARRVTIEEPNCIRMCAIDIVAVLDGSIPKWIPKKVTVAEDLIWNGPIEKPFQEDTVTKVLHLEIDDECIRITKVEAKHNIAATDELSAEEVDLITA